MIGVIVVTHGQLANELVNAAETIVGALPQFVAVSIGWHDDPTVAREAISGAIARLQGADGVLILTDMFGGTPSNIALSFLGTHPVEVITGVNLPMMVKFPYARQSMTLSELAHHLQECGQRNITIPGDMLKKKSEK